MRHDIPSSWNDEVILANSDKATDILGFKEVVGVGQLIYHPFGFKKYELNINKNSDYYATPFCRHWCEPIFLKEDFLSGHGLVYQLLQSSNANNLFW